MHEICARRADVVKRVKRSVDRRGRAGHEGAVTAPLASARLQIAPSLAVRFKVA
jgi:hypothetical protein